VLSHGSAAALWRLLRPIEGPIDVSVSSRHGRVQRRGIRLHRCPSLSTPERDEVSVRRLVTVRNRIPVTTVPRTIDDLRGSLPPQLVRRAMRQAELAGYQIAGVDRGRTRSDLEDDFLRFCLRYGLPRPEVNVKVGRFEIDFVCALAASRSKPMISATTAAASPMRTITRASLSCGANATRCDALPGGSLTRNPNAWRPTFGRPCLPVERNFALQPR
jgi:hypothetical protein